MTAALIAVSLASLGVIGALVGLAFYFARDIREARINNAAISAAHNAAVKASFEAEIKGRLIESDLRTKEVMVVRLDEELGREIAARKFVEDRMRRLTVSLAKSVTTEEMSKGLIEDLQLLEELRRPPAVTGVVQQRKTPAETPRAKAATPPVGTPATNVLGIPLPLPAPITTPPPAPPAARKTFTVPALPVTKSPPLRTSGAPIPVPSVTPIPTGLTPPSGVKK